MGKLKTVHINEVYSTRQGLTRDANFLGLVASLKERGWLGAVTVRPYDLGYEIIDGYHRWRAAIDAQLTKISIDIVVDLSDEQLIEHQIMKSIHRVETKPEDYVKIVKALMLRERLTFSETANRLGIPLSRLRGILRGEEVQAKALTKESEVKADAERFGEPGIFKMPPRKFEILERLFGPKEVSREYWRLFGPKEGSREYWTRHANDAVIPAQAPVKVEPIHRQGWDNVMHQGRVAYLHEKALVFWRHITWGIDIHGLGRFETRYHTALEAMEVVEGL